MLFSNKSRPKPALRAAPIQSGERALLPVTMGRIGPQSYSYGVSCYVSVADLHVYFQGATCLGYRTHEELVVGSAPRGSGYTCDAMLAFLCPNRDNRVLHSVLMHRLGYELALRGLDAGTFFSLHFNDAVSGHAPRTRLYMFALRRPVVGGYDAPR